MSFLLFVLARQSVAAWGLISHRRARHDHHQDLPRAAKVSPWALHRRLFGLAVSGPRGSEILSLAASDEPELLVVQALALFHASRSSDSDWCSWRHPSPAHEKAIAEKSRFLCQGSIPGPFGLAYALSNITWDPQHPLRPFAPQTMRKPGLFSFRFEGMLARR
jgi:hypothetical protein